MHLSSLSCCKDDQTNPGQRDLIAVTKLAVISATWELELRRIVVQGQPGQKNSKTLSQPTILVWWHTFVIPAKQEA
jgi:hypothetical protein